MLPMRLRRSHILMVIAIVASLAPSPVTAVEAIDAEPTEATVVPMTIEGRSLAAWAAEVMSIALTQPDEVDACQPDSSGRVMLLARAGSTCIVRQGQPIFVPIVARSCRFDDRLLRRAERAVGKRQDDLWSRVNAEEAAMFRCLHVDLQVLDGPYLAVDGDDVEVDESFFAISEPVTTDDGTYRWPGYYAMVEPLPPGQHTIVTGHEAMTGSPLRVTSTIEVVDH